MLLDPLLSIWVPVWVAEQYVRWNPSVHVAVDIVSTPVADRRAGKILRSFPVAETNQQLLRRSTRLMQMLLERRDKTKKKDATDVCSGDEGGASVGFGGQSSGSGGALVGDPVADEAGRSREVLVHEDRLAVGGDDPEAGVADGV